MKINKSYNNQLFKLTGFAYITRAVILSYIITLLCFLTLGIIIYFTNLPQNVIPIIISIVSIISVISGGIYISKIIKNKGWLRGAIVGLMYVVILLIIGQFAIPEFDLKGSAIIKLLIGIVLGSIGGIIGIST